jgi:hypothetical protein
MAQSLLKSTKAPEGESGALAFGRNKLGEIPK